MEANVAPHTNICDVMFSKHQEGRILKGPVSSRICWPDKLPSSDLHQIYAPHADNSIKNIYSPVLVATHILSSIASRIPCTLIYFKLGETTAEQQIIDSNAIIQSYKDLMH